MHGHRAMMHTVVCSPEVLRRVTATGPMLAYAEQKSLDPPRDFRSHSCRVDAVGLENLEEPASRERDTNASPKQSHTNVTPVTFARASTSQLEALVQTPAIAPLLIQSVSAASEAPPPHMLYHAASPATCRPPYHRLPQYAPPPPAHGTGCAWRRTPACRAPPSDA